MLRSPLLLLVLLFASGGVCAAERGPSARGAQLWLGGDVHLGPARGDVLSGLLPLVSPAVGVVNLEGPIGDAAEQSSDARLVNAPRAAQRLRAVGIGVAGVSNNHAGDLGEAGAAHTRQALAQAGVQPAGPGQVAHLARGGLRLAVTAHDLSAGVPPALAQELAAARASADVLVATFHVRAPPLLLPPPELKEAVEMALRAGAVVVAAHGSHAIARVERRGAAVIAWGLGNLAFACDCTREQEGLLLKVSLTARGVTRAEAIPIDAGLGGAPARPAADPGFTLDVLQALGSSPFTREADRAVF